MRFEASLIIGYLPFWIANYGLALVAWSCLACFSMQVFMAPDSRNYIWRGFRLVSAPGMWVARLLSPAYIVPAWWPLVGALWVFAIRFAVSFAMLASGLAPRLSTMQPG
jgi:hypothetical protein